MGCLKVLALCIILSGKQQGVISVAEQDGYAVKEGSARVHETVGCCHWSRPPMPTQKATKQAFSGTVTAVKARIRLLRSFVNRQRLWDELGVELRYT